MAREGDPLRPPGKLNVKTGPPLVDIMIFSTVLVAVGCHLLRFSGCFRFLAKKTSTTYFLAFFLDVG